MQGLAPILVAHAEFLLPLHGEYPAGTTFVFEYRGRRHCPRLAEARTHVGVNADRVDVADREYRFHRLVVIARIDDVVPGSTAGAQV